MTHPSTMSPEEVRDAFAYGIAQLSHMPIAQLKAEADAVREAHGLPPSAVAAPLDALAYGLAKLLHTPLGQLKIEADRAHVGQTPRVPSTPELLAQIHTLDAQIQQTDREIAARPYPAHPQGPKESAEWAELQTWWVNKHWRPFVSRWDRGIRDVRDYEAGIQRPGMPPLVDPRQSAKLFMWVGHMSEQYRFLRQSAGGSFYIDVSSPQVSGLFDDVASAFKGAVQKVASFVRKPPGWFAAVLPLFTMENQRYWAGKLGGSTGEKIYDAGVKAIAAKYLGPQGPALVETYNKVTDDAARGNLNAKEILAKAPEIAKLAAASKQGPDAFRAAVAETGSAVEVSGDQGEEDMSAYAGHYVGADGQSYPEVAARAVQSVHAQHRSPYYGYIRSGINQKIYLFPTLDDTRAWFSQHIQLQPDHDYAAAFAATDLRAPIAGMEHFMRANVSGDNVGSWWPFFLGLPLGGLGGYFLRRWQEQHPGQALPLVPPGKLPAPQIPPTAVPPAPPPKTSGDPYGDPYGDSYVGGPWLDVVGQDYGYGGYSDGYGFSVGGPWHDVVGPWVGAEADDTSRRRSWPQTRALIQSAIDEVRNYAASYPAAAYVWSLDAPSSAPYAGRAPGSTILLEGTTNIVQFSSQGEALNYLREVAQTRPVVALAMFERSSPHWPNPVAWRKSDRPEHEPVIAQHVASKVPTQTSGTYMGAEAESATAAVRRRAQQLAERRAGSVIGVIHTAKDGLWHTLAFRAVDDADDWLGTATADPASFTYAAYFDKADYQWPHPVNDKIGSPRRPARPGAPITRDVATTSSGVVGAAIDDARTYAKALATRRRGNAAGVIHSAEGLWSAFGFASLDDAIDWLQSSTHDKTRFTYAAAYEKGSDGTAYIQAEEFGRARPPAQVARPIPREVATTGQWWAA